MPELLRSFTSILRTFVGNRRWAPRYLAKLPFEVSIIEAKGVGGINGHRSLPSLTGHTFDLSSSGIGLIVPAIRIGDQYLTGDDRVLRLKLELGGDSIQLHVRPVRYEKLEGDEHGYIIGAHILEIGAEERALYLKYLKGLA